MALRKLKEKAIILRKRGLSYSQIKDKLDISKSTLSNWLKHYPLSSEIIKQLRDKNPQRIERFRETMLRKRNSRLDSVYSNAKQNIGTLTKRELLLAGLFLYWGEGSKGNTYEIAVSNTDPAMMRFFIRWFACLGVPKERIRVNLHIYSDMNAERQRKLWSQELDLPISAFNKVYVKESKFSDITYRAGFRNGTCMLRVYIRDITEKVHMSIWFFQREMFKRL